jgi:hypothetical protein
MAWRMVNFARNLGVEFVAQAALVRTSVVRADHFQFMADRGDNWLTDNSLHGAMLR